MFSLVKLDMQLGYFYPFNGAPISECKNFAKCIIFFSSKVSEKKLRMFNFLGPVVNPVIRNIQNNIMANQNGGKRKKRQTPEQR